MQKRCSRGALNNASPREVDENEKIMTEAAKRRERTKSNPYPRKPKGCRSPLEHMTL